MPPISSSGWRCATARWRATNGANRRGCSPPAAMPTGTRATAVECSMFRIDYRPDDPEQLQGNREKVDAGAPGGRADLAGAAGRGDAIGFGADRFRGGPDGRAA